MKEIIKKLYHSKFVAKVVHTLVGELQEELRDCKTVLDLGCGPSSPLQYCKNITHSVGVEVFQPYLEESKKKAIHSEYIEKEISQLDFPESSFDVVVMIEVIEHLSEKVGMDILQKSQKWARKKVIVSSPNGFVAQKAVDGNSFQQHLSGWDYGKMKKMGFKSRGLAGLKLLRQEVENDTMGNDLMTSIKFSPKFFWFIIASLSQIITYYLPRLSFELFSVKKNTNE